jgi:hypothetical protein
MTASAGHAARAALLAALLAAPLAAQAPKSSCIACHGDPDMVDTESAALVKGYEPDIHAQKGLSCQDCHGGNPDAALAEDMDAAMDPKFGPSPFVGAPERTAIPAFCGRCHSEPEYMKRFRPGGRVDQEREYWTSRHGKGLARGDSKVATCVDCHGVHGILPPGDSRSPVHPTHVAETCKSCHGSQEHMAGYRADDGSPLPIDQFARWSSSVHAAAMFEKGDLSAPTCNDCHGNHGAAPPGLDSVTFVCGQCHGREADLFRASPKHPALAEHNKLLADAGEQGCASCHEAPDPAARLTGIRAFSECTTCHEHHAVVRPTVAILGSLPPTPCAFCHESRGPMGEEFPEPAAPSRNFAERRDQLLASAPAGLEGDELFDWLVDQALALPNHTLAVEGGKRTLRPEFGRLFSKFRIGKRHFTYDDPVTGKPAQGKVRACVDCHAAEPSMGEPSGQTTALGFRDKMWELSALTARSERILLAARRGGVETREASEAIDQAVDAQIELEVLVHSFSTAEDGAFAAKHREGLKVARLALEAGQRALGEVRSRRTGLIVFLAFVVLALIALGFKIRRLPPPEHE